MTRKPSPTTELSPDTQINPDLETTQNIIATVNSQFTDERDLVNQLLGQVQMARSFAKFADVVSLSKLKQIKESKIYQALKGKKGVDFDGNEIADVGTWDGFCQALGLSRSKVDEDLTNLTIFGEDALKQLSAVGAGYRELRQFRRLPEDQKSALIEVAKDGDKNAFIELAEEMISKHAKEKENLSIDLEISRQTLGEKKDEINKLRDDKSKLEEKLLHRVKRETPEAEGAQIAQEVTVLQLAVIADINNLDSGFNALIDHTERTGTVHAGLMAGLLDDIENQITALRQQFNLPEHQPFDPRPDWVKDELGNEGGDNA